MSKQKINIALVDDDEVSLSSIRMCMQSDFPPDKYNIISFTNANDFIATLQKIKYQALILDLEMPEISGIDLINHLQKIELSLPIILLTGNMQLFYDTSGLHRYIFDVHFKPTEYNKIAASVRDAVKSSDFYYPAKKQGSIDDLKAEQMVITAIMKKCEQLEVILENNKEKLTPNTAELINEQKKLIHLLLKRI